MGEKIEDLREFNAENLLKRCSFTKVKNKRNNKVIRFSNVSKAYHGATQPALQGLNFHLPVGSMTYLVGHSGVGKIPCLN